MDNWEIECPECGRKNEFMALNVPAFEEVACSHCRTLLGTWGDLYNTRKSPDHSTDQGYPLPLARSG